ncbi:MAG: oligosaccharide flippase family protein [Candidatus Omnitrophica bacterium]|nr:oligosaccharide flippase family protein [Candidatus Omnitrophota bacterium]
MSLKKIYKVFLTDHSGHAGTFFVIAAGSISLMLANLIFARVLPAHDFGQLSLFFTIISFVTTFGLLGMDQSLIRAIISKEHRSDVPLGLIGFFGIWIVSTAVIITAVTSFFYRFAGTGLILTLFAICFSIATTVFLSSILRARFRFFRSQVMLQGWKILIFSCSLMFYFKILTLDLKSVVLVLLICCLAPLSSFIRSGIKPERGIPYAPILKRVLSEGFMFAGLVITVGFMNTLDRLAIPKIMGYDMLADYTVFWTIICGPFILLQTGIGFVLLPWFRKKHIDENISEFTMKMKRYIPIALFFVLLMCVFLYFFSSWFVATVYPNKYYISQPVKVFLVLLGVLRLYYAFISAMLGAVASFKDLVIANAAAVLSVLVFFIVLFVFGGNVGLFGIVFALCSAWLARNISYTAVVSRSIK